MARDRRGEGHSIDPYNDLYAPFPELAFDDLGDEFDAGAHVVELPPTRPDRGWQRLGDVVARVADDLAKARDA